MQYFLRKRTEGNEDYELDSLEGERGWTSTSSRGTSSTYLALGPPFETAFSNYTSPSSTILQLASQTTTPDYDTIRKPIALSNVYLHL